MYPAHQSTTATPPVTSATFLWSFSGTPKLQATGAMLGQYYSLFHCILKPCSRRLMQLQNPMPARVAMRHRRSHLNV